jgi:hypothetical protein
MRRPNALVVQLLRMLEKGMSLEGSGDGSHGEELHLVL